MAGTMPQFLSTSSQAISMLARPMASPTDRSKIRPDNGTTSDSAIRPAIALPFRTDLAVVQLGKVCGAHSEKMMIRAISA